MAQDVTSWWKEEAIKKTLAPVRRFMIGSSDYSAYVLRWPKLRQRWDDIRPQNVTIDLANEAQTFNFFFDNTAKLNTVCTIDAGFTHPTSGDELITMHQGKVERVRWRAGRVSLTVVDKFQQLSDRQVGTEDEPVTFTGSNYLPSDIAWWLVTSYGGFSAIESATNPDVHWSSWIEWSNVFSDDAVFMNAYFDGVKITEALRHIGRMTRSAIYVDDNLLRFHRFTIVTSPVAAYGDDQIEALDMQINDGLITNKQYVPGNFDPETDSFGFTVFAVDSSSINSFGLREDTEKDEKVWYVTSGAALNLAQRLLLTNAEPYGQFTFTTGLHAATQQLGDHVLITDEFLGITAQVYRILGREVDMDRGGFELEVDESQSLNAFRLDYSALDSTDVLA